MRVSIPSKAISGGLTGKSQHIYIYIYINSYIEIKIILGVHSSVNEFTI